jgi:hypothetical protein
MIHAYEDSECRLSGYGQKKLKCIGNHLVQLYKDGKTYYGIYNLFSNWGYIEDGRKNFVEEVYCKDPPSDDENAEPWKYYFTPKDFAQNGYSLENG